jgi:hypothetical protein
MQQVVVELGEVQGSSKIGEAASDLGNAVANFGGGGGEEVLDTPCNWPCLLGLVEGLTLLVGEKVAAGKAESAPRVNMAQPWGGQKARDGADDFSFACFTVDRNATEAGEYRPGAHPAFNGTCQRTAKQGEGASIVPDLEILNVIEQGNGLVLGRTTMCHVG